MWLRFFFLAMVKEKVGSEGSEFVMVCLNGAVISGWDTLVCG